MSHRRRRRLVELVSFLMEAEGYPVSRAYDGLSGLREAAQSLLAGR